MENKHELLLGQVKINNLVSEHFSGFEGNAAVFCTIFFFYHFMHTLSVEAEYCCVNC